MHPNGTTISFNKSLLINSPIHIEINVVNVVIIEMSKICAFSIDIFLKLQKFETLKVSKCDESDNNNGEKIFIDYLKKIDLIIIYSKVLKMTKSNTK